MDDSNTRRTRSKAARQRKTVSVQPSAAVADATDPTAVSAKSADAPQKAWLPPTESELLAAELLGILNDFAARIPDLAEPHPATARSVRRHRTISKEFMRSAIFTSQESDEIQSAGTFNVDAARAAMQFADAFRVVAERLQSLTSAVNFTIELKMAEASDGALRVYGLAKVLARDASKAEIGGWAGVLKKHLGRKGRGSKVTPPPDPAP
jgi:hypothetical protein